MTNNFSFVMDDSVGPNDETNKSLQWGWKSIRYKVLMIF